MTRVSQPQQDNSLDIDLVRTALEPDYVVLEELGRGGMAIVYKANEKALDREVAIKVLPSFMAMDGTFVERFQHEARTAGQLEHPNIVPIYRVGRKNRVIYFVMKLLRGQSLAAVLRERTKLTVPEIRRILIETAAALGYAAKRSVVHRDIKPDNILLDDESRCVVTDFGIAKSSGGPLTAAGTSMGTPRYMSPEHARGIPLDGRSDMYSLGVVAYQCLTGKTPFDADDPFAILYKHINEPLPQPTLITEDEWALYAVIAKMLAKSPEDRFQTADELIEALGGGSPASNPTLVTSATGILHFQTAQSAQVGFAPTEIIVTPTFGTRMKQYSNDRRVWLGAASVAVLALVVIAVRPKVGASPANVPAPIVAGSTTGARAAPGMPGATIGPTLGPTVGATSGATSGATTRVADAGATTGATTNAKVPPKGDSGRPGRLTRLSPAPAAARASALRALDSKCPANARPDATVAVLVDSVRNQSRAAKLTVNFDACRLAPNTPFDAIFTLEKLNQGRFGRQDNRSVSRLFVAVGPRSRHSNVLDLAGLSAGRYALHVVVRINGRDVGTTRRFQIAER